MYIENVISALTSHGRETMWTRQDLHELIGGKLRDNPFVVVSNREPYMHSFAGGAVEWSTPASGVVTALDPVMRACGGIWVAHGNGSADRQASDAMGRVAVPPDNPSYTLRRVWLTKAEEDGYYYGFSNEGLWPLCHVAYTRPEFAETDWQAYRAVNQKFADAVLDEIGDGPAFVFIQDYQLALLPRLIKRANPRAVVAQFWHIPWPNPEVYQICPWSRELLDGLLGNDLLGFHIRQHRTNFIDAVDLLLESRIDRERFEVVRNGRSTALRAFPISIDFEGMADAARGDDVTAEMARLRTSLGLRGEIIGLGLDRIDYTKGIPERLRAFDRFLERSPQYLERVVFLQVGVPSRTHIPAYKRLNDEVDGLVEDINWKHGVGQWKPIIHLPEDLPDVSLLALRRMADFAVVSSLHDGMNLVAKEYVASRFDERGVLLLSPFTGAARELSDALIVNPYAIDAFAAAIKQAVEMPSDEQERRMQRMRAVVREHNVYKWAADIITELARLRVDVPAPTRLLSA